MERIVKDNTKELAEDDDISMKSARDEDLMNLSKFTVYHSAQDLDNPKTALFQNADTEYICQKVSCSSILMMSIRRGIRT